MREILLYACLPFLFILGLFQPFYALIVYVGANILRPEMLFWGANTGALVFRVSIASALLGFFLKGNNVFKPLGKLEFWLVFWIWVAIVASLLFATLPQAPRAAEYEEEFFKFWILGWLILGMVVKRNQIVLFENAILTTITFIALWGWDQHFRGNERLEGLGGHAAADSNGVAALFVLFLPIALNKMLTATNLRNRVFGITSSMLLGIAIVFTQSRGGFIAVSAGILYLLISSAQAQAAPGVGCIACDRRGAADQHSIH